MQKVFVGLTESRKLALGVLLGCALALPAGPAAAAPPTNDNFAAAAEFGNGTPNTFDEYYAGIDTAEATLEQGETQPTGCVASGGSVGRTVWMRLVARAGDGWRRLELSDGSVVGTPGHELDDAVWTVWTGSSLSTLAQVDCDDNSGADRWPNLIFPVANGQTYYLQIGGVRAAGAPDAWGGSHPLFVARAAGPPAVTLDGAGNETGSPVEYVQPGVEQHWEILTSGQTTTYTGGTTVACTVDGIARPCSTNAGLDVTPSSGEHTIVAKLVYQNEDVWATTTKRFTAGAPPTTTGPPSSTTTTTPSPDTTVPVTTPPPSLVAPTLTLGKLGLATIARKRAIAVRCAVNQPGRCRVTVTINGKTAKRLRLTRSARKPYRLAAGSIAFSAAGTKTLRLAIARTAAKRIRRASSLQLQFTTTGEYATATRSARRSLTVQR
jgi:hypothetical protein